MDTTCTTERPPSSGDSSPERRPYLKGFNLRQTPRANSYLATTTERHFYASLIEQLTAARKARGWSQEALSQRIGVSDPMVAKWESGHRLPSSFYLMSWAQALELSIRLDR